LLHELVDDQAYLQRLCSMLNDVERDEIGAIQAAAEKTYQSLKNGGLLHVFSTGHSHMIVEELFYRAGGLVPVNPILDNSLMLHEGAITSTKNERISGLAENILKNAGLKKDDTILISSNTGINNVPVEAAIYAKRMGLTVICVTSLAASRCLTSRHCGGMKLYEVSDIVIDNHAPLGDGLLSLPTTGQITGGASTFSSLFIAQRIVLKVENLYLSEGVNPPIFKSANLPKGDEYNESISQLYKHVVKALR